MRSKIAATVALVALLSVLVVRTAAVLTSSTLMLGLVIALVLAGAAAIGMVVASRVSTGYEALLRRDRAVAVAASHELRTPITALRLSLEDLTMWKETSPAVAAELHRSIGELDRLSDAVTELLDRRHDDRPTEQVDLTSLVGDVVARWRPHVAATHTITFEPAGPLPAALPSAQVCHVLDAMIGHATARSSDGVVVTAVRVGTTLRVRVAYEDPRRLPTGVIHASANAGETDNDLALAEAGGIAESVGGYLGVQDTPGTSLMLILPSARGGATA